MVALVRETAQTSLGVAPGMNMFGVPGMTTGAVSIITMMISGVIIWYIRGMADRRRADNENVTTLSGAHDILFKNMQTEIERLSRLVSTLSAELNTVKKELAEERRARLGEIKNSIQVDLAASSIIAEKIND